MTENTSGTIRVVTLQGDLSIQKASGLADELKSVLDQADRVVLDIGHAERIDLACIQVLYAAKKTADGMGKELVFNGAVAPEIAATLAVGGFCKTPPEDGTELGAALVEFDRSDGSRASE
jgi:anti-anti-sigma regulatory factor